MVQMKQYEAQEQWMNTAEKKTHEGQVKQKEYWKTKARPHKHEYHSFDEANDEWQMNMLRPLQTTPNVQA